MPSNEIFIMTILRSDWRMKSEQNWLCRSPFECLQYAYTG